MSYVHHNTQSESVCSAKQCHRVESCNERKRLSLRCFIKTVQMSINRPNVNVTSYLCHDQFSIFVLIGTTHWSSVKIVRRICCAQFEHVEMAVHVVRPQTASD